MADIVICYKKQINSYEMRNNESTIVKIKELILITVYWSPNEFNNYIDYIENKIQNLQEYLPI